MTRGFTCWHFFSQAIDCSWIIKNPESVPRSCKWNTDQWPMWTSTKTNESPELAVNEYGKGIKHFNYRRHPDAAVVVSLGVQEGVNDKAFLKDENKRGRRTFGTLFHSLQSHLFDKNICFLLESPLDFSKASSNKQRIRRRRLILQGFTRVATVWQHIGNRSHSWSHEREGKIKRSFSDRRGDFGRVPDCSQSPWQPRLPLNINRCGTSLFPVETRTHTAAYSGPIWRTKKRLLHNCRLVRTRVDNAAKLMALAPGLIVHPFDAANIL